MKKTIILSLFSFLFVLTAFSQERTCGTMENLELRKQKDPNLEQRMEEIEAYTKVKVAELEASSNKINGEIITIPVVVHVLYRNSTENISEAQIQSQLDVLNEDFRRTNSNADNTWSQAADTQIEFCLSTIDPNGNATTGITRKQTTRQDWGANDDAKRASSGGINPWNTSEYLNMWIVPKMTTVSQGQTINLLGYAQFPGGSAATDGLVMIYNAFGRVGAVTAPYDGGRTTTHEIGHFLNLRHIWGDSNCGNDFVSDTPTHRTSNSGCPVGQVSCSSTDMPQNYMDYTNDSCMNLFTLGQKNRMRAVLEAGGARRSLALSDKCGSVTPQPTCTDGIQNGDETGVDCGGSCSPCQTGNQYCASNGNSTNDEYISRVQLGSINKTSGAGTTSTGYSNFTNTSTDLSKGATATIRVTPTWTGTKYNEGYAVFIDYNKDGDFTDAGETVWTKAASQTTPAVGTFTIPTGAATGATRMRVSMKYNGIPTSCESFQYGEVEDYTVNIVGSTPTVNYCSSNGNSTNDEYISRVRIGSINKASGVGTTSTGYSNFTSTSTNLSKGTSSTITITPTWTGTKYNEGYAVFIDYNRDGDFTDSGETVWTKAASQTSPVSGSFTIPNNVANGVTRMRVSMKYNGVPTSCESFQYGEVEDYTVNIGGGNVRELVAETIAISIYPNPVKDILYIKTTENLSYTIVNMLGQEVERGNTTGNGINVSDFKTGLYMIQFNVNNKVITKKFIKQ
ncbi:GEVED domain-containing protein [Pontimicrobium sp. MEBiC01747]